VNPSRSRKVGVLVGSLRRGSYSRMLAKALVERAPATLRCEFIEIAELPLYNEDLDATPPAAWVAFRQAIKACDALLFVTPEYNRSLPGCLKNATDIASRPQGESVLAGLPAAVVSVSPYSMGGFGANHALRQSFVYLDLRVMQQPEAYVANVRTLMDETGRIISAETDAFLIRFMKAFDEWSASARAPAEDFDGFLARREAISGQYIQGHWQALRAIATDTDPATLFPPHGERVAGAAAVNAAHEHGAQAFRPGSTGRFEVLQSGSAGDLGFWTGIQHAQVRMAGQDAAVPMRLRTTEIFRLEDGAWKLVHRHADLEGEKR
jgi:NAD(P)H-dependent FMN reductase/ketosteroid isomerase-like protein